MNIIQKAARWMFSKAVGFPPWGGSFSTSNYGGQLAGWGGTMTAAGIDVNGLKSMQSAAVYGCCSVLDRVISSLPRQVYQETSRGKIKAESHWSYKLLRTAPNPVMSSTDFFSSLLLAFNLYGNAYVLKKRLGDRIVALWPMHPERMNVKVEDDGSVTYIFTGKSGTPTPYTQDDVIHVRDFAIDGIHGLSPISQAREVIGQDLAAQQYGSSIYKNGGFVRGVIRSKQQYNKEKAERWRTTWENTYGSSANAGKVGILWEDAVYDPIIMKPVDVEYMAQRRYSAGEIACLHGVPLMLLQLDDKPPTFASAEQVDLQFVKYKIAPTCGKFEAAFNKGLYGMDDSIYFKFGLAGLLRGDAQTRAQFYSTMVQNGIFTRNECRELEDLQKSDQDGADDLTVQSNMLDLAALQKLAAQPKQLPAPATTGGSQQ